jgi:sulfate transport system substrate-binding protein
MFTRLFSARAAGVLGASILLGAAPARSRDITLLNVSYDTSRELYADINKAFSEQYQKQTGDKVTVRISHGGSGTQARTVIDGGKADVVTLALSADIDAIAKAGLTAENWQSRLPDNSLPYTSTILFLVRKGNPKGIKDWGDLVKGDVKVMTANPKVSGGARWNYLAAWGWALQQPGGDDAKALAFVKELYQRVPVLESGARATTVDFAKQRLGDVLLVWEYEANLTMKEFPREGFQVVAPSLSILAEPPVAVVDKLAAADGVTAVAEAYLKFLYTPVAQEIIAQNYFRPREPDLLRKYAAQFNRINLFAIDEVFGDGTPGSGWKMAQAKHFADGGIYDREIRK